MPASFCQKQFNCEDRGIHFVTRKCPWKSDDSITSDYGLNNSTFIWKHHWYSQNIYLINPKWFNKPYKNTSIDELPCIIIYFIVSKMASALSSSPLVFLMGGMKYLNSCQGLRVMEIFTVSLQGNI